MEQLIEIKDDIQIISSMEEKKRHYDVLQRIVSELYLKQSKSFLIQHQLQSYNLLFEKQLREAIEGFNPIIENQNYRPELQDFETKFEIRFKNIRFKQPFIIESDGQKILLTPQLARLRYCNYLSQIHYDIEVTQYSYIETKDWEKKNRINPDLSKEQEYDTVSISEIESTENVIDPEQYQKIKHKEKFENLQFIKIPVMVGSKACVSQQINMLDRNECEYDLGGYFIIQGNEKVIISQDRICENKIFVFRNNKNQMQTYMYRAEVRSTNQRYCSSNKLFKIQLSTKSNQNGKYIRCTIQNIRKDVPLFILFRALGIETDSEIISICGQQFKNELAGSIYDANSYDEMYDQQKALQFLEESISMQAYNTKEKDKEKGFTQNKKMKKQFLQDILKSEFLCHIEGGTYDKIIFLRDMVEALILTDLGFRNVDDRDSQCNKRIEPPGILMVKLFRSHFNKFRKYIKSSITKEMKQQQNRISGQCMITETNKDNIFKSTSIEQGLRSSLSTGFWGDKNSQGAKPGVAQVLNRMNYASTCSHLRRINTHLEKNDKTVIGPRYIHNSQYQYICPVESPEGGQIGLVKNLALGAQITHGSDYQQLIDVIDQMLKLERITQKNFQEKYFYKCKLEINGQRLYYIENNRSLEVYEKLLELKRKFIIDYQTSVIFDYVQNIIKLNIEAGRLTRPLFITESLKRLLDKNDKEGQELLRKIINYKKQQPVSFYDQEQNKQITNFYQLMYNENFPLIEFVDTLQSEQGILIAVNIESKYFNQSQYTEIEPQFMLSLMSSGIPYSNFNQAPRNAYYSSMAKQAIGIHSTTYRQRFDTTSNVLNQLQMPLIKTHMHEYTNMDKMPFGQNVTIAVMCYTGFNQEDSIIMNKSAIERGLFHHTQYKTYKEKNVGNLATGEEEMYTKIIQNGKKSNDYSKINEKGLVDVGRYVQQGDVIMSKQLIQKGQNNEIKIEDTSYALKNNETGYIDSIVHQDNFFKTKDHEAHQFTKVRIRLTKQPVLGDKFASIHAQKGLLGKILPEEDMPYSQNGIKPDVIINPHAFPSRMTIGQLLEILHGNLCLKIGKRGYGDTFNTMSIEQMRKLLTELGMNSEGNSIFYNGYTGDQFKCDVFSGSCYMIRLKHLADNKIHAREISGPITVVTRQPSEGRQKKGGLKFGYMEIDCQLAHGQYNFLREKMLDTSDLFQIIICNQCNTVQSANKTSENFLCRVCESSTNFTVTYHNYSTNIFAKELQQMNIKMRYITDKIEEC